MEVKVHINGSTTYTVGSYTLVITGNDSIHMRHECPKSHPGDDCYNAVLPREMKSGKCSYCDTLDVPESLQCLYQLYKYGQQGCTDE